MVIGKYLSLEEAREKKKLDRFIKEHPSEGNQKALLGLIDTMVKKPLSNDQTSRLTDRDED